MSNIAKLSNEDKALAHQIMEVVDAVIKREPNIGHTEITLDKAKRDAITHHSKFIHELGVTQNKVDVYKVCSWYGFYLAKHLDDPKKLCLWIVLEVMNLMLSKEKHSTRLSDDFIKHLHAMTQNDGFQDEFGVGKNGIYSAFSACKNLTNELSKSVHFLPLVKQ
jgi:hypothetical protein